MAVQIPLVVINGQLERVPSGDTLAVGTISTTAVFSAVHNFTPASGGDTYAVTASDEIVLVVTATFACGVLLPTPVGQSGRNITVKDKSFNAGTNNIAVSTAAGLIDGSATYPVVLNAKSTAFVSDGANWFVI